MMDRHSNAASDKVKLLCHACGARYLIPVSKIRGRRFRARCKRCSEEIVARYRGGEFEVLSGRGGAAETPAPVDADAIWYVAVEGEPLGPITAREVEGYVYRGEVNADTYTWCESLPEWLPLAEIRELRHLVFEQARGIDHSAEEPPTAFFERDEAPRAIHSESDPSVPTRVADPGGNDVALADTAYFAGDEHDAPPTGAVVGARLTGGLPDSFSEPGAASADEGPYTRPIGRAPKDWDAMPAKPVGGAWADRQEDWPPADAPPADDLFDSYERPWTDDQEPGQLEAMDEFEDEATRLVRQRVDDIPDRRELTGQVRRPEDWSQVVNPRWGQRPGKVESSQIQSISGIELKKKVEVSEVRLWVGARGPVTLPPPSMTMGESPLRHLTSKGLPPPPSPPPPPIPAAAAPAAPAAGALPSLVPPPAAAALPASPPPPSSPAPVEPLLPPSAMAGSFDAQIPSLAPPGRVEAEEQVSDILPSLVPQLPTAAPVAPPVVPSNLLTPQRPFWTPLTIVLVFLLGLSVVAGATVAVVLVLRRPAPVAAAPEAKVAMAPGGATENKAAPETKPAGDKRASEQPTAPKAAPKEAAPKEAAPKEAAPKEAAPKAKVSLKKRAATKRRTRPKKARRSSRRGRRQKGVDALVDSAAGDVLAAGRKGRTRKKKSGSAADDVLAAGSASAAPTQRRKLDRASIKRSMTQLKPRVRGCFDRFKQGGVLKLRFTIRGNGTARGRAVGAFAGTPTAACVEGGISSMRFPRFSGPATTVTYPFRLQ